MTDSTNPRVMADNIKKLSVGTQANADAIEAIQIYDDAEIDTGKKWIDGRAIYRKVITGDNIKTPATTNVEAVYTFSEDIDIVTNLFAYFVTPIGTHYGSSSTAMNLWFFEKRTIRMSVTSGNTELPLTIIVEYVKSNPTP